LPLPATTPPNASSENKKRKKEQQMKKMMMGGLVLVALTAGTNAAQAATSSGTLAVTGTVESSISMSITPVGGSVTNTGTAAVISDLGNISKYSTAPAGFSLTKSGTDWTLSSTIGVRVDSANITSLDYALSAQLSTAPASGIVWKIDGSALNEATPTTLGNGNYATNDSHTWDIVVADSAAAASINNTITFTAVSN
jgi:hypothetical protein